MAMYRSHIKSGSIGVIRLGDGEMGPTPRPSPSQEGNVGRWGDREIFGNG
ncbi:MAG: hypothetical protein F6K18_05815 [Okeania sp. SIO2C2]|nr:hypothetical protein [Okeania sp. SIO2C2]